jgi:uncharacterized protein (TIGR00255 family)
MAAQDRSTAIKSMTGFVRVSGGSGSVDFDLEVKSVNHRYLDITLKGLSKAGAFEKEIKTIFQKQHSRGRIDISILRRAVKSDGAAAVENRAIDALVSSYMSLCKRYGVHAADPSALLGTLLMREGLGLSEAQEELTEEELGLLRSLVEQGSDALSEARRVEGRGLVSDIEPRLASINSLRSSISQRASGASSRFKERLLERVATLAPEVKVDPERLALEVALLADRVDISEELARLEIHLTQFGSILKQGHKDGVGRTLDFITQEIGRELNTIGSKAQDATVQGCVVEAKAELERIREQVQNIE